MRAAKDTLVATEQQELLHAVRAEVEKLLQMQNLSEEEKSAILASALQTVRAMEGL